jgi:asparagine synthase (glutamine-hydrolysing)
LECCLQIPAYVLSHGGTDRTIARAAFRDALPFEIVQRSSKGAVNRYFYEAVYGNHQHIRPFLLDGLLADQGLLDRSELKRALDDPTTVAHGWSLTPIMTATICEMWLRTATSLIHSAGSFGRGAAAVRFSGADHPTTT